MQYEVILLSPAGIKHITFDEFIQEMCKLSGWDEERVCTAMLMAELHADIDANRGNGWISNDSTICGCDLPYRSFINDWNWIFVPNYIIDDAIDIVFSDIISNESQVPE